MEFWKCRFEGLGVSGDLRFILNFQVQEGLQIYMFLKVRREILVIYKDLGFLSI